MNVHDLNPEAYAAWFFGGMEPADIMEMLTTRERALLEIILNAPAPLTTTEILDAVCPRTAKKGWAEKRIKWQQTLRELKWLMILDEHYQASPAMFAYLRKDKETNGDQP